MIDLSKIFDGIEKLAYDILIWILLVPKTLVKILVEPSWVPGYVTKELEEKTEEEKFDDYLSPVLLILIAALLPYLYILITPAPGVVIDSSAKIEERYGEVPLGNVAAFWAVPDFKADTYNYTYQWSVQSVSGGDVLTQEGDYFEVPWDQSDFYFVDLTVQNDKGEIYAADSFLLYVLPEGESPSGAIGGNTGSPSGKKERNPFKELQGEGMIIPALVFLSLPMLFAIATEAFRGYPLMRSTLRRSFYIQCYYFSPFILVMWSYYLGSTYFITPAEFWISWLDFGVFVFAVIWLIWNETHLIYSERGLKSRWVAAGIVTACIVVIVGIAAYVLLANPELFRQSLEGFYLLAAAGVFFGWLLLRRKRRAKKLSEGSNTP